jgi:hypothetical protein
MHSLPRLAERKQYADWGFIVAQKGDAIIPQYLRIFGAGKRNAPISNGLRFATPRQTMRQKPRDRRQFILHEQITQDVCILGRHGLQLPLGEAAPFAPYRDFVHVFWHH